MAVFLLLTGMAFFIPETSKARIAVGTSCALSGRLPRRFELFLSQFGGFSFRFGYYR
jgi:hypothetical protein